MRSWQKYNEVTSFQMFLIIDCRIQLPGYTYPNFRMSDIWVFYHIFSDVQK